MKERNFVFRRGEEKISFDLLSILKWINDGATRDQLEDIAYMVNGRIGILKTIDKHDSF